MLQLINLPLTVDLQREYGAPEGLEHFCAHCGCDGLELVWGGEDVPFAVPPLLPVGWHLTFYTDWLDFWNEDTAALNRKFGAPAVWQRIYGGATRDALLEHYRRDLNRAMQYRPRYVVYHVSDVSLEEGYTYCWEHSDEAVIDAAAEMINFLTDGMACDFVLLVENLQWAGFTFTRPEMTERLLSQIHYPDKGIMLDTGHLMCTNPNLKSQEEGVTYIHRMLTEHGTLCRFIRGIHLHQSVSGAYVKSHTGALPDLPENYWERFATSYQHILQIDTHQPWTSPDIASVVARIKPDYLVHELAAATAGEKERKTLQQLDALRRGAAK